LNFSAGTVSPVYNGVIENAGAPDSGSWSSSSYTHGSPGSGVFDQIGGWNTPGIGVTADQFDGYICELGVYNGAIDAGSWMSLYKGFQARRVRPAILTSYWPIWGNTSPEPDIVGRKNATVVGSLPKISHPRIFR
jgi:hypothetical protein